MAAAHYGIYPQHAAHKPTVSPESALAGDIFDQFCNAVTFKSILALHRRLCDVLRLRPTHIAHFYPKLKAKLKSWRAQALWTKFDKRANHRVYNRGKACTNSRVLIIGCGPCGLRAAIEAQLLGAKVVVVEKRDRFSRNNVLHLWPFLIHDLRALGAKKFFGKFCAGAIDHISIRQLQCILLKVALLLGVEVHENISFEGLLPPPEDQSTRIGWRAQLSPPNHPAAQYEFDALIGADGKRNTLQGFGRKEFRGKLAIAITANFVNRHSEAEARVQEISGVAFIFNQKFFKDLYAATGIDLENIVYYKDDTHYFVMTAKKQSLLAKGVILQDFPDTQRLLAPDNVSKNALMDYAREAADFSTNYQLPTLDFAVNHYGQPDVAMFDFTSMFAAENASRVMERYGHRLLMQIVGDSLLEPFWPTGSGCARGFLSCFDACWSVLQWSKGTMTPVEVVAERESIYRLLAQTTPENLHKDFNGYSLEPYTRYPNLNMRAVLSFQVRSLYDTDNPDNVERACEELDYKRLKRAESILEAGRLLAWLKEQVEGYPGLHVEDLTTSLKDGLALCAVIDRYRPDLLNFSAVDPGDVAINNQLAFDILQDLGISMVMTGIEMAQCDVPDTLTMLAYLTQVYDLFRSEIPQIRQPVDHYMEEEVPATRATTKPTVTPSQRLSHLNKASRTLTRRSGAGSREGTLKGSDRRNSESLRRGRKRRSTDKTMSLDRQAVQHELDANREERKQRFATAQRLQFQKSMTMLTAAYSRVGLPSEDSAEQPDSEHGRAKQLEDMALFLYRLDSEFEDKKRRLEKMLFQSRIPDHGRSRPVFPEGRGGLEGKVKDLEEKLRGNAPRSKPKDMIRAIGKLEKSDWNVQRLDKKREENEMCVTSEKEKSLEIKICKETFSDKYDAMNKRLHGLPTEVEAKYAGVDQSLKKLEKKLKEGSTLEVGQRGSNKVSAMAEQFATKLGKKEKANTDVMKSNFKPMLPLPPTGGSENCHFCQKRVYLMERMSAEGKFFHRTCFKCQYCAALLRLGSYSYVRDDLLGGLFLCMNHVNMQYHMRSELKRKLEEVDGPPTKMTLVTSAEKSELTLSPVPPSTPPASPAVTALQAMETELRGGTPERVEFENSASAVFEKEDLVEIDEEEWTDRNFGPSATPTSDDASSSDFSGEEDEYEGDEDLEVAGELPMTAYETLRLAKDWHRKYSQDEVDDSDEDKIVDEGIKSRIYRNKLEDVQETQGDIETEDGIYFKVPGSRRTAPSESDTEVGTGSDDEEGCEEEEDYDEEEFEEDYDEEEEEEESEDENSATEIETDSEFDVDHIEIRQEIPTIVVEESGEQCNGSIESMPPAQPSPRPSAEPLAKYVEQRISLEDTAMAGTQAGGYDSQRSASMSHLPQTSAPEDPATAKPQRPGLLANLRRHELTSNSTSDIQAAKHAALRKQYLLGPSASAPVPQKSASVAQLDTKLKSLNDRISEAQKLLNPAPQPSPSMQVFLEKSSNLFQSITPMSSGPDIGKFAISSETVRNADTGPTTLFGTVLPKIYVPLDMKKTGQDPSPLWENVTDVKPNKELAGESLAKGAEAVVSAAVVRATEGSPTSDGHCALTNDAIVEKVNAGIEKDLTTKLEVEKKEAELMVYEEDVEEVQLEDEGAEAKQEADGGSQDGKSGRKAPLVETCINVPLLLASEAAPSDKCDSETDSSVGESSSDEEDSAQDGECKAESFNGDTSSSLGSDTESEFDRIYEASNEFVQFAIPYVEIEDTSCLSVPLATPKAMETLPEMEEDCGDESPAVGSSEKIPVTETRTTTAMVLKNIAVQEDFDLTPEEGPVTELVEAVHPKGVQTVELIKEIVQETSKRHAEETLIEQIEQAQFTVCSIPRARSGESIDSARLLTETENSDWGDDLKEEYHINAEFVTTRRSKEKDMKSSKKYEDKVNSEEKEKEKPARALLAEMEDIDFADQSSTGSRKDLSAKNQPLERGYLPLQNDLSPEEGPKLVLEKKSTPFAKSRDSLAIHREKTPLYNPELTPSLKKYLPSPSVARKKEALSQERERQNDLIRDLVLARIPGPKRRGSRDSMSPPSSNHASRAGSEARTMSPKPSVENVCKTPTPVPPPVRSSLPETPITHPQKFLARELFTPTKTDNVVEFKTPIVPPRTGEPKITTVEREQARQEARVKAQAKRDAELGLSPPDYITNLKDKLRRKASVTETETDSTPKVTPSRARAFSEPQPGTALQIEQLNSEQAAWSISLAPPISLPSSSTSALPPVEPIQLGDAFQRESTSSPTGLSPPQSPRSTSSKSSSYLWAGLSPAESIEGQLDDEAAKKPAKEAAKSTKKSKDPERRKSLIQTIAGIFKSSDKKEKEPPSPKNPKSPIKDKIPLLKSTPKKEKDTTPEPSKAATPTPKEDAALRNRALSSPCALELVSVPSERDTSKESRERAVSYTSPPSSSSMQRPTAVSTPRSTASPRGASLRDLTPPSESSLLESGHRQSKQAKQAARQAELKRLRMAQAIQRQLEELEVKQKALEEQGVKVEKALRGEEGGTGKDEATLMQEWFHLVHEKNALSRFEQELMVRARELELEDRHARLQQELKERMAVEESKKSPADIEREGALLSEMLEIVEQREALLAMLEEDKQRYREEDKDLEAQMLAKGLRLTSWRKESQV